MLFDKLVKEYSNSLNINQLSFDSYDTKSGQFYIVPKPNSTVYANSTLTAQINVSNSAVLTYNYTIVSYNHNSGKPTFKYRGNIISNSEVTYSVSSLPTTAITFNNDKTSANNGILTYGNVKYDGGLFVITGTYVDPIGNEYSASWSIFCQRYDPLITINNADYFTPNSSLGIVIKNNLSSYYNSTSFNLCMNVGAPDHAFSASTYNIC
jgi:hypothetical protein